MIKRIKKLLKQNNGMALLLVLCLFALLIGLGASVFFASVTSVKSVNKVTAKEQAYLSAVSVCEVIKSQIISDTDTDFKQKIEGLKPVDEGGLPSDTSIEFTSSLPGKMGTVKGDFIREEAGYGVLNITASVRDEDYTLHVIFARVDNDPAEGGTEWIFSGYRPL